MKIFHLVIILFIHMLAAGCASVSINAVVEGEVVGGTDTRVVDLTMKLGNQGAKKLDRLRAFGGRDEDELIRSPASQLRIDVSGEVPDFTEAYHFMVIGTDAGTFNGGTSMERAFVVNHVGRLSRLSIDQGQPPVSAAFSGRKHIGSGWLAVAEDDDRIVPWDVTPGTAQCFDPPSSVDCVDMERITRELFTSIADNVESSLPAQIPFSTVVRHRLYFVPRVVHNGFEAQGRRARGVGFIYYVQVDVPTITFDIYVPISILFLFDEFDYRIMIDPLSFPDDFTPGPENLDRIYVRGSHIGAIAESTIRDGIRDAIKDAPLPEIMPQVAFEDLLNTAINATTGVPPKFGQPPMVSKRHEAILLPVGENTNNTSTVVWERLAGQDATMGRQVQLVFLE